MCLYLILCVSRPSVARTYNCVQFFGSLMITLEYGRISFSNITLFRYAMQTVRHCKIVYCVKPLHKCVIYARKWRSRRKLSRKLHQIIWDFYISSSSCFVNFFSAPKIKCNFYVECIFILMLSRFLWYLADAKRFHMINEFANNFALPSPLVIGPIYGGTLCEMCTTIFVMTDQSIFQWNNKQIIPIIYHIYPNV